MKVCICAIMSATLQLQSWRHECALQARQKGPARALLRAKTICYLNTQFRMRFLQTLLNVEGYITFRLGTNYSIDDD
ncbi:hypothetical protein CW354_06470 [Marinicaulis flavus]|uniref:Uncharacterized protein n=1 Tax=Hyphococcus luteus TaxID=2058213 RepID=A0A2S7K652_9PROT|nr:hypothetical protein CW354_06470 [Marinicaulis flavus]